MNKTPTPTAPTPTAAPESEYPLMDSGEAIQNVLGLIDMNLGAQSFSALHLAPIKVPAGGARDFLVEGAADADSRREIQAVIVAFRQTRAFWKRMYGTGWGGKKPPDCTSVNGFTGVGDPGGECLQCPYAQFGTATNADGSRGAGQACKDMRQLLLVLPGQLLPHVLNLPPTSIRNFLQYSLHLVSSGVPFWGVVTRLTLETASSAGGINYSRVRFQMVRRLEAEQTRRMEPYHQRMRRLLEPALVEADSYEIVEEEATGSTAAETAETTTPASATTAAPISAEAPQRIQRFPFCLSSNMRVMSQHLL